MAPPAPSVTAVIFVSAKGALETGLFTLDGIPSHCAKTFWIEITDKAATINFFIMIIDLLYKQAG